MHVNNGACPACSQKLTQVCSILSDFARILQKQHPDAHISTGYRNDKDQQIAYDTGHSNAKPGQSKHNKLPAEALDWFRLTQAGGASFDGPWYRAVLAPSAKAAGLVWGGDWKSIKDLPHVELK